MTDMNELKNLIDPRALRANNKYTPKLSAHERGQVLSAVLLGFAASVVAAAFQINPSTLRYIIRPNSPHYKSVRKEYQELGEKAFLAKYVDEQMIERLNNAASMVQSTMSVEQMREQSVLTAVHANKRANRNEGLNAVEYYGSLTPINVQWFDNPPPHDEMSTPIPKLQGTVRQAGWYYTLDGSNTVLGNMDDRMTSTACLRAAERAGQ